MVAVSAAPAIARLRDVLKMKTRFRFQLASIAALLALIATPVSSATHDITSFYVATKDGTRLAVDVVLPGDRAPDAKLPTLIELTRYWRASENPTTGQPYPALDVWDRAFLSHGYAVVQVDVRGTGASFGTRDVEYGPQEVRDGWDIVEWIVGQPWSNGKVGAYGTSYTGTTAELLTATGHRLAIAGADAGIFERVPPEGTPTLTFERNSKQASYLELPVVGSR